MSRPVQHRDGQLQALLDAERQALGLGIGDIFRSKRSSSSAMRALDLVRREMEQLRMQLEVLPDRELAVEREGLRHVADAPARLHVVGAHRLAEQLRRAFGGGQQPGQHFHGRGLAAAVRAEKAEDLAARDAEAHMIDGDEVAEPRGSAPPPRWRASRRGSPCAGERSRSWWCGALLRREQRDEGGFEVVLPACAQDFVRARPAR